MMSEAIYALRRTIGNCCWLDSLTTEEWRVLWTEIVPPLLRQAQLRGEDAKISPAGNETMSEQEIPARCKACDWMVETPKCLIDLPMRDDCTAFIAAEATQSTAKGPERRRRTPEEFVEAVYRLLDMAEPETPEEVDAFLRAEGLDPEQVGNRGLRVVAKAALKKCARLADERDAAQERAEAAMRLLESLTPSGSEFHNDPERCAAFISGRLAILPVLARERNEARSEAVRLREALERKG